MAEGVELFLGVTQYGKTTKALERAEQENDAGRPYLVLDCMPAKNFRYKPHAVDRVDLLRKLYGNPPQNVIYTPKDEEDLAAIFTRVHQAGILGEPRTILWDECSFYMSYNFIPEAVSIALRGWAHSDNLFLLVTQQPADLNGVIYITSPRVYCYRLDDVRHLERVEERFQMDREKVKALQVGEFEYYPKRAA